MIKLIIIVWFVLVSTLAVSAPHPGKKAFSFNGCVQCHSSLAISPAQITAKYQGQQGAYGYLLNGFRKGSFDVGKVSHGAIDISDKHLENIMEWLVGNRDTSTYASNTKTPVEIEREEKAIKKERQEARLREFDRKHEERMAAINSQQNQAAAQASTQTSQNNYPSDSTSGQSRPDSSARHDNTNYGNCISVTSEKNRYVVYKNNCSENLTLLLCQVSDGQGSEDNYSRFQDGGSCPSPGFGAVDIRAGATHKKAEWFDFNNYRFFYYACKTGWIPVNESGKYVTRINESFLCKN